MRTLFSLATLLTLTLCSCAADLDDYDDDDNVVEEVEVKTEPLTITTNNSCINAIGGCNSGNAGSVAQDNRTSRAVLRTILKRHGAAGQFYNCFESDPTACSGTQASEIWNITGCSNISYSFGGKAYDRACVINKRVGGTVTQEYRLIYGTSSKYAQYFRNGSGAATQEGRIPNNALYSPPPTAAAPDASCHMSAFPTPPGGCNVNGAVDLQPGLCVKKVCN